MRRKDTSKQGTLQSKPNMSAEAAGERPSDAQLDIRYPEDMIVESDKDGSADAVAVNPADAAEVARCRSHWEIIRQRSLAEAAEADESEEGEQLVQTLKERGEKRRRKASGEFSRESPEEYVNVPSFYIRLLLECFSHPPSILQSSIPSEKDDLLVLDFLTDLIDGKKESPSTRASVVIAVQNQHEMNISLAPFESKFSLIPFQKTSYDETDFNSENRVSIKSRYFTDRIKSALDTSVHSYLIPLHFDETKEVVKTLNLEENEVELVLKLSNSDGDSVFSDIKRVEFGSIDGTKDDELTAEGVGDVEVLKLFQYSNDVLQWYKIADDSFFVNETGKEVSVSVYLYNQYKNQDFTIFQKSSPIFTNFFNAIRSFGTDLSVGDMSADQEKRLKGIIDLYHKIGGEATLLSSQALNQLLLQQPGAQEAITDAFSMYSVFKAEDIIKSSDRVEILGKVRDYIQNANIGYVPS